MEAKLVQTGEANRATQKIENMPAPHGDGPPCVAIPGATTLALVHIYLDTGAR